MSGFTANVLDITEKTSYLKTNKIKNISRIHHVKYDYSENETKFHVWQYSNIGPGKKFDVPVEPKAPRFEEKVQFYDSGNKFGFICERRKNPVLSDDFTCTEEACVLTFTSFTNLQCHLNFGRHHFEEKNKTQLAMVCDRWAKIFEGTVEQIIVNNKKSKWSTCYIKSAENRLGYARTNPKMTERGAKITFKQII